MSLRELLASAIVSGDPYPLLEALVEAMEPEEHTCGECGFYDATKFTGCNCGGVIKRLWPVCVDSEACSAFWCQARKPEDTDATIRKELAMVHETCDRLSHDVRDAWALAKEHRQSRDEARAKVDRLLLEVDNGKLDVTRFCKELAEAQAQIELLHKQGDYLLNMRTSDYHARAVAERELTKAKAKIERLRGQCEAEELCKGYPGLCTEGEAVVKSIKADAEIGRLVRGMADRTRLIRGHPSHAICQKQMYYWVEKQSKGARSGMPLCDWRKVEGKYLKADPADALRAIQEGCDEQA